MPIAPSEESVGGNKPTSEETPKVVEPITQCDVIPVETESINRRSTRVKVMPKRYVAVCKPTTINPGWGSGLTPEIVQFMVRIISPYLQYRYRKKQLCNSGID